MDWTTSSFRVTNLSRESKVASFWNGRRCSAITTAPIKANWTGPRPKGSTLVLDIDVQGARQLKERIPAAVSVFILAPSRKVLEQRLRLRSQDSEPVIERRLREAAEEIRNYSQYDFVLVNHEVAASLDTLVSIVKATRSRRDRMEEQIRPILDSFE